MFRYYLKLALLSTRKNPMLSVLMVAAIAIGIGACMTVLTVFYVMSGDPIPSKSSQLYYVQLDSWDPNNPYDDETDLPPDQVTYLDATALLDAAMASRQAIAYRVGRVIEPGGDEARPFEVSGRATTADFFAMFDVPFLFGGGWSADADRNTERVVVLSRVMNERVFGGADSTGERLVMNGESYRVAGVLSDWNPVPKFYDVTTNPFDDVEDVFFPFSVAIENELNGWGNTNCWKPVPDGGWASFLNSECIWMQFWVELETREAAAEYLAFLDGYVASQKELGRFPRPLNNRLSNVTDHLAEQEVVDEGVQILLVLAILFLLVCLLNTVGLLLAKVLRRTGDISLRRALGASQRAVFSQYIVEAGLVGVTGGVVGIGVTWLGLVGIQALFRGQDFVQKLAQMDWVMLCAAIGLALVSALAAALYPTWRAVRVHPAAQLKAL
ncbi:MAG: ABC transporter permease [Pseudomonadota bacterium]